MILGHPARAALAACLACLAWGGAVAAPLANVLLKNGIIFTQSARSTLDTGDVLITDGKVAAIGRSLTAPPGIDVIDLKGRPVTPAFFGGLSFLGVQEIGLESASDDTTLRLGQMRPEFEPALAFNPDSVPVGVARADGVGFSVIVPGAEAGQKGAPGSSILTGLASVATLDGRTPRAPVGLAVTLGEGGAALAGSSRAAAFMLLSQALEEARSPQHLGSLEPGRLLTPAGGRVLAGYIGTQKPLLFFADRASDIRAIVDFCERQELRAVIVGGAEAWRVAPLLARARVPVALDPFDSLPESFDGIGTTLENAARLNAAGVTITFSLRSLAPFDVRKLRQGAGNAVAHGLPWKVALAALTNTPARLFGADGEFGTIEVGKPANLVVWSGDPLEVTSVAEASWLDGRRQTARSRQTELRDRYLPKVLSGTAR